MDLGKAIKTIRVSKGLTQRQLGKAIGCSETNMLFMGTGRTFPRKSKIDAICKVLEIPMSYLLMFSITPDDIPEDKQSLYTSIVEPMRNEFTRELLR